MRSREAGVALTCVNGLHEWARRPRVGPRWWTHARGARVDVVFLQPVWHSRRPRMSVDTRLNPNLANLDALAALDRQGLEGRQTQLEGGVQAPAVADVGLEEALRSPAVDDGELALNAPAWDEPGPRLLATGDFQLAGSDRGQDLDAGVDSMVAPLA